MNADLKQALDLLETSQQLALKALDERRSEAVNRVFWEVRRILTNGFTIK